ncbi:MAG: hypothetical protein R6W83_08145 [Cryobacterium sp.]
MGKLRRQARELDARNDARRIAHSVTDSMGELSDSRSGDGGLGAEIGE